MEAVAGAGWTDFNVAMAGAGAALAGLIIVAISVNLEPILQGKTLPSRAAASIATLVLAIVAACLGLMPSQSVWVLGLEVAIGALIVWTVEARALFLIANDASTPGARLLKAAIGALPLAVISAGAVLLLLGHADGAYAVAIGSLLAVVGAVLFSWVALIELRR